MMEDLYHILQVDPIADPEVIEAAYRQLARKYHPDVYRQPDATQRMQALNDAYAVLRDPVRRAAYDRERPQPAAVAGVPPAAHVTPPAPVSRASASMRARDHLRRQKIGQLNAAIQQLEAELARADSIGRRQRVRIGLAYLLSGLLLVVLLGARAGSGPLAPQLLYGVLAAAGGVALIGGLLVLSTLRAAQQQQARVERLRAQVRQGRQNLGH